MNVGDHKEVQCCLWHWGCPRTWSVPTELWFSCHLLLFCACRKLRQRHQKAETAGRVRIGALWGFVSCSGVFCVVFLLMLGVFRQRNLKQPISQAGCGILSLCSEREIRASTACTRLSYRREIVSYREERKVLEKKFTLFLPFSSSVFCSSFTSLICNNFNTGFTS